MGSKTKGLLPVVHTSLYKRIKSSINMETYTAPNPSLGWPVGLGGRKARPGEQTSQLGPDEAGGEGPPRSPAQKTGVGDPGAASKGLCGVGEDLVGGGGGQVSEGGLVGGPEEVLQPGPGTQLNAPPLPSSPAKCKSGVLPGSLAAAGTGSSQSWGRDAPGGTLSAVARSGAPLGASLCSDLRGSKRRVKQQGGPDSVELGECQLPVLGRDPWGGLGLDPGQFFASPGGSFRLPHQAAGSALQL